MACELLLSACVLLEYSLLTSNTRNPDDIFGDFFPFSCEICIARGSKVLNGIRMNITSHVVFIHNSMLGDILVGISGVLQNHCQVFPN